MPQRGRVIFWLLVLLTGFNVAATSLSWRYGISWTDSNFNGVRFGCGAIWVQQAMAFNDPGWNLEDTRDEALPLFGLWFDLLTSPKTTAWMLMCPTWPLILATAAGAWATRAYMHRRTRRLTADGACHGCGYDLTSTPPWEPCPECDRPQRGAKP